MRRFTVLLLIVIALIGYTLIVQSHLRAKYYEQGIESMLDYVDRAERCERSQH